MASEKGHNPGSQNLACLVRLYSGGQWTIIAEAKLASSLCIGMNRRCPMSIPSVIYSQVRTWTYIYHQLFSHWLLVNRQSRQMEYDQKSTLLSVFVLCTWMDNRIVFRLTTQLWFLLIPFPCCNRTSPELNFLTTQSDWTMRLNELTSQLLFSNRWVHPINS